MEIAGSGKTMCANAFMFALQHRGSDPGVRILFFYHYRDAQQVPSYGNFEETVRLSIEWAEVNAQSGPQWSFMQFRESRDHTYPSSPKPAPFPVKNPAPAEALFAWVDQLNFLDNALRWVRGLPGGGKSAIAIDLDLAMYRPSILDEKHDSENDQDSIYDSTGSLVSEDTLTSTDSTADFSENDCDQWDCGNCENYAECDSCGWNCFRCIDEKISRLKLERDDRRKNIELWEKALQTISEPISCP